MEVSSQANAYRDTHTSSRKCKRTQTHLHITITMHRDHMLMCTAADIRRAYTRNSSSASPAQIQSADPRKAWHARYSYAKTRTRPGACHNHVTYSNADADATSQGMHLALCFVHAQTTQTYTQMQQAKVCISCIGPPACPRPRRMMRLCDGEGDDGGVGLGRMCVCVHGRAIHHENVSRNVRGSPLH